VPVVLNSRINSHDYERSTDYIIVQSASIRLINPWRYLRYVTFFLYNLLKNKTKSVNVDISTVENTR
jgi:hypothetical protein